MMAKLSYPTEVRKIAEILRRHGHEAYAVGGCVRDMLMGKQPHDFDLTTSASPEEMLAIFEGEGVRTIPTGLKHGTVSVLLDGELFECTTYRIDGSYTDSRHPDKVTFTRELCEDLRRRDFTVNAMAGDPLSDAHEVIDLYGGRADIKNKIIRAVGDPKKRFTEDALRILRAVRFATVLNFEIEAETKKAAAALSCRLADISSERKSVELEKLLCSPYADRGVKLLFETDTAKYIHKDICAPKIALNKLSPRFPARLSALFYEVPDLDCMKLSGEVNKTACLLCSKEIFAKAVAEFEKKEAKARKLLQVFGSYAEDAAVLHGFDSMVPVIADEKGKEPCITLKQLAINGQELLSLGLEPRALGEINKMLLNAVLENPESNQKELLLSLAKQFYEKEISKKEQR